MKHDRRGGQRNEDEIGPMDSPRPRPRWSEQPPLSWIAGLIAALAVGAFGLLFAALHPQEWEATTQLLVVPQSGSESQDVSAYWETLSSGQVSATAAGIIGAREFVDATMDEIGIVDNESITATVSVVPGTSLVEVEVRAPERVTAEQFADKLPQQAISDVNRLMKPFVVRPLGSATDTAEPTGITTLQFVGVLVLAAVVAGLAVQQLVQQLAVRRRALR